MKLAPHTAYMIPCWRGGGGSFPLLNRRAAIMMIVVMMVMVMAAMYSCSGARPQAALRTDGWTD